MKALSLVMFLLICYVGAFNLATLSKTVSKDIPIFPGSAPTQQKKVPPESPSPTPSPVPIPRTLNGYQFFAQNSSALTDHFQFGPYDKFSIEINIENATSGRNIDFPHNFMDGKFVGSLGTKGPNTCFGIGMSTQEDKLVGARSTLTDSGKSVISIQKSQVIYVTFEYRHTYRLSYNGTHMLLYIDNTLVGIGSSPDETYNCDPYSYLLTVGAAFNTTAGIDYFANGKYYWMRILRQDFPYPFWYEAAYYDFTQNYGTSNDRLFFPNLAPGAYLSDTLIFRDIN